MKITPTKEGLVAELTGDFAGLLELASGGELNLRGSGGLLPRKFQTDVQRIFLIPAAANISARKRRKAVT